MTIQEFLVFVVLTFGRIMSIASGIVVGLFLWDLIR